MSGETAGWVKSIHETTYGELVGVVIVGQHATDLIEAAVVALDAEATIETVADGMAPHPTLSEASRRPGSSRSGASIDLPPTAARSAARGFDGPVVGYPPAMKHLQHDATPPSATSR